MKPKQGDKDSKAARPTAAQQEAASYLDRYLEAVRKAWREGPRSYPPDGGDG